MKKLIGLCLLLVASESFAERERLFGETIDEIEASLKANPVTHVREDALASLSKAVAQTCLQSHLSIDDCRNKPESYFDVSVLLIKR